MVRNLFDKFHKVNDTKVPDRFVPVPHIVSKQSDKVKQPGKVFEPPMREAFHTEHYQRVQVARGFVGKVPDYLTPLLGKKCMEHELPIAKRSLDYTESVLGLK
jgi:hypothetical protein